MNEITKIKILTFIRFLGDGFFYPFLASYLTNIGLMPARIGFILSLSPLISILVNPIYSRICKNIKNTKLTLGIASILEGALIFFFLLSHNYIYLIIIASLIAVSGSCHYHIMDSLLTLCAENNNKHYGDFRIYGSIAYVFATVIGGLIIKNSGYPYAFLICFILFSASGVFYLLLKTFEINQNVKEGKIVITKVLVYFFIFYLLFIVSFNAITNMLPVYFEANSIHEDLWGYTYGLMVAFEVITLLVLNKLKKVNINFLLILSIALFVLRLAIYLIDISIYVKLAFTLLRGISYGIVLYCVTPLLKNIVGSNNLTKTYLFMMLLYGIMYFAFNNLSGIIIEKWGYNTLFITFIIISMISIFFLILLIRKNKQDNNNLLTE